MGALAAAGITRFLPAISVLFSIVVDANSSAFSYRLFGDSGRYLFPI
jgi:hypothetical protein